MGGSHWGVIHNQSDKELVYILHYEKLTPTEAKVVTEVGAEIKAVMTGPEGGINGKYSNQTKSMAKKVDCLYTLQPTRFTKVGLQDVDFDSIKFLTISANGKILQENGAISKDEHIRIKVRPDLSVKIMEKEEAEKIKKFAEGVTGNTGFCPQCKGDVKAACKDYKEEMRCQECKDNFDSLWTCGKLPQKHLYCEPCYEQFLQQNEYKEE